MIRPMRVNRKPRQDLILCFQFKAVHEFLKEMSDLTFQRFACLSAKVTSPNTRLFASIYSSAVRVFLRKEQ